MKPGVGVGVGGEGERLKEKNNLTMMLIQCRDWLGRGGGPEKGFGNVPKAGRMRMLDVSTWC